MKKTLCLGIVFMASTLTCAADAQLPSSEPVAIASASSDKGKESLIKQSVKKADINEEVGTQALKLGGIHRREDAREYLELKKDAQQSQQQLPVEKAKVKNVAEIVASK